MSTISIKVLDPRLAEHLPRYATPGSAAVDLCACIQAPLTIEPGAVHLIPAGFSMAPPGPELAAMILPRSGLGHKNGIVLGNLVGLIDSDYRGQVMVSLWNRGSAPFTVQPMERMAQMVFVPVAQVQFLVVEELPDTSRGEGGFGSTGSMSTS